MNGALQGWVCGLILSLAMVGACKPKPKTAAALLGFDTDREGRGAAKVDGKTLKITSLQAREVRISGHASVEIHAEAPNNAKMTQFAICPIQDTGTGCRPTPENPGEFVLSPHTYHSAPTGQVKIMARACVPTYEAVDPKANCGEWSSVLYNQVENAEKSLSDLLERAYSADQLFNKECQRLAETMQEHTKTATSKPSQAAKLVDGHLALGENLVCEALKSGPMQEYQKKLFDELAAKIDEVEARQGKLVGETNQQLQESINKLQETLLSSEQAYNQQLAAALAQANTTTQNAVTAAQASAKQTLAEAEQKTNEAITRAENAANEARANANEDLDRQKHEFIKMMVFQVVGSVVLAAGSAAFLWTLFSNAPHPGAIGREDLRQVIREEHARAMREALVPQRVGPPIDAVAAQRLASRSILAGAEEAPVGPRASYLEGKKGKLVVSSTLILAGVLSVALSTTGALPLAEVRRKQTSELSLSEDALVLKLGLRRLRMQAIAQRAQALWHEIAVYPTQKNP